MSIRRNLVPCCALGLALLSTLPVTAQEAPNASNAAAAQAGAVAAGVSLQFLVRAGQIAVSKAKSPAVQSLAKAMTADFEAALAEYRTAGGIAGGALPAAFSSDIDLLETGFGRQFEQEYLDIQIARQKQLVTVLKAEAASAASPATAVAVKWLPRIEAHLEAVTAARRALSAS